MDQSRKVAIWNLSDNEAIRFVFVSIGSSASVSVPTTVVNLREKDGIGKDISEKGIYPMRGKSISFLPTVYFI